MHTDNLATQMIGDDLGFEGMTFLVEAFLVVLAQRQHVLSRTAPHGPARLTGWAAFLSLSQGVSVASTKTSSYLDSSPLKVRLLGKVYFPEAIKVSSTLMMMRWTVGSLTR